MLFFSCGHPCRPRPRPHRAHTGATTTGDGGRDPTGPLVCGSKRQNRPGRALPSLLSAHSTHALARAPEQKKNQRTFWPAPAPRPSRPRTRQTRPAPTGRPTGPLGRPSGREREPARAPRASRGRQHRPPWSPPRCGSPAPGRQTWAPGPPRPSRTPPPPPPPGRRGRRSGGRWGWWTGRPPPRRARQPAPARALACGGAPSGRPASAGTGRPGGRRPGGPSGWGWAALVGVGRGDGWKGPGVRGGERGSETWAPLASSPCFFFSLFLPPTPIRPLSLSLTPPASAGGPARPTPPSPPARRTPPQTRPAQRLGEWSARRCRP